MWDLVDVVSDGTRLEIDGLNVWDHPWQQRGAERASVQDPDYGRHYEFPVYTITDAEKSAEFAAGEFSNAIWGFYVRKESGLLTSAPHVVQ